MWFRATLAPRVEFEFHGSISDPHASIVHVGGGECDVAAGRSSEFADVAGSRVGEKPAYSAILLSEGDTCSAVLDRFGLSRPSTVVVSVLAGRLRPLGARTQGRCDETVVMNELMSRQSNMTISAGPPSTRNSQVLFARSRTSRWLLTGRTVAIEWRVSRTRRWSLIRGDVPFVSSTRSDA